MGYKMDGIFKVPIRNLFCLLSYANEMPELVNSLNEIDEDLITYDFMARKFLQEVEVLLKHRFVKNYVTQVELTKNLGGRMLVNESMPYLMTKMPIVVCEKDLYSSDILLNRIMKSTLRAIRDNRLIKEEIRKRSYLLMEAIPEIKAQKLTKEMFNKIHFSRHTAHYKRMVHIARLLHELVLLSHKHGKWSLFTAELDEKALNQLFEKFLFHFYRIEQKDYSVSSEIIQWQLSGNKLFLPSMKTDVSLMNRNGLEKIVIDAKFYKNMFQENYGKSTFHSHNMYQLFTYLMHQPSNLTLRGILIYPFNGFEINEVYQWDDRINIEVRTINLNESWGDIYSNLMNVIKR